MYQKHSETSREAYRTLEGAKEAAERIYNLVDSTGFFGISAPHVAAVLNMVPGTVAARVIGLERDNRVIKLERTEKSPSGRPANIIVSARYKAEVLALGDRILFTKPEETAGGAGYAPEALELLKEVENYIALGTPILYGSPLHKRIQSAIR